MGDRPSFFRPKPTPPSPGQMAGDTWGREGGQGLEAEPQEINRSDKRCRREAEVTFAAQLLRAAAATTPDLTAASLTQPSSFTNGSSSSAAFLLPTRSRAAFPAHAPSGGLKARTDGSSLGTGRLGLSLGRDEFHTDAMSCANLEELVLHRRYLSPKPFIQEELERRQSSNNFRPPSVLRAVGSAMVLH